MLIERDAGKPFDLISIGEQIGQLSKLLDIIPQMDNDALIYLRIINPTTILTHANLIRESYTRRLVERELARGAQSQDIAQQLADLAQRGTSRSVGVSDALSLVWGGLIEREVRYPFPWKLLNTATEGG